MAEGVVKVKRPWAIVVLETLRGLVGREVRLCVASVGERCYEGRLARVFWSAVVLESIDGDGRRKLVLVDLEEAETIEVELWG